MNEILEALRKNEITVQGKKNPNRYLYLGEPFFYVQDYSKDSYGELICSTEDIEFALCKLNQKD